MSGVSGVSDLGCPARIGSLISSGVIHDGAPTGTMNYLFWSSGIESSPGGNHLPTIARADRDSSSPGPLYSDHATIRLDGTESR